MDDGTPLPSPTPPRSRNPLRRLYAWILTWAHHPLGTWALAFFAFVDSSIFPVPPLFLQVALSLERPRRSWWYATVDLVGSILGAVIGFLIGALLYESVGKWVIETWGYQKQFDRFGSWIHDHGFWFTLLYSFVPFPYKVITIGTGFFGGSLPMLLVASSIGRALRFYALAAVCFWGGKKAKDFIDRRFNQVLIGIALFVLLVIFIMKVGFQPEPSKPSPEKKAALGAGGGGRIRLRPVSVSSDQYLSKLRRDSINPNSIPPKPAPAGEGECRGRGSNPHGPFRVLGILSPLRLPIPPPRRERDAG